MGNAISACFKKYATFTGRATRSEYWFFFLFAFLMRFVANIFALIAGSDAISWLVNLVFFIPGLAVTARRMHDVDKSGWFMLIPVYSFILAVTAGTAGANRFGDPE